MKRILSLLLILCMLVSAVPLAMAKGDAKPNPKAVKLYQKYIRENQNTIDGSGSSDSARLADLDGDGTPELLVCQRKTSSPHGQDEVKILTYRDGELETLFYFDDFAIAGASTEYAIFQLSEPGEFLFATYTGNLGRRITTMERFTIGEKGALSSTALEHHERFNDATGELSYEAYKEGAKYSVEECEQVQAEWLADAKAYLLGNYTVQWAEGIPMMYRASELRKAAGNTAAVAEQLSTMRMEAIPTITGRREEKFFTALAGNTFQFRRPDSDTNLTIHEDGSFQGSYVQVLRGESDPELGTTDTKYVSEFTGQFSQVRRMGEHKYAMLVEIKTKEEPDQVSVDKKDPQMRIVTSEPGAMTNAEYVYLYTPGQWLSEVPYTLAQWCSADSDGRMDRATIHNPANVWDAGLVAQEPMELLSWEQYPTELEYFGTKMRLHSDTFHDSALAYRNDLGKLGAMLSRGAQQAMDEKGSLPQMFDDLGVEDQAFYNLTGPTSMGCGIAHKILYDHGQEIKVLFVVAGGTLESAKGDVRYASRPGCPFLDKYQSYEFPLAYYDLLREQLRAYMDRTGETFDDMPLKIFVTGHSLGGAAANLLGASFTKDEFWAKRVDPEDVYVYTFGALDSVCDDEGHPRSVRKGYANIHNIYNVLDSFGPNGNWNVTDEAGNSGHGHFGHLDVFQKDYRKADTPQEDTRANHSMKGYIAALNEERVKHDNERTKPKELDVEKQEESSEPTREMIRYQLDCPADVEVLREDKVQGGVYEDKTTSEGAEVPVLLWSDENGTNLCAPADCRVRITAREEGTMNLHAGHQAAEEALSQAVFTEVPLEEGQVYVTNYVEGKDEEQIMTLDRMEGDKVSETLYPDGVEPPRPIGRILLIALVLINVVAGVVIIVVLQIRKKRRH